MHPGKPEIYFALRLFEFQEQLMIDTFWIKLTQTETTESLDKVFLFRWEIFKIKFIFETRTFTFFPISIFVIGKRCFPNFTKLT